MVFIFYLLVKKNLRQCHLPVLTDATNNTITQFPNINRHPRSSNNRMYLIVDQRLVITHGMFHPMIIFIAVIHYCDPGRIIGEPYSFFFIYKDIIDGYFPFISYNSDSWHNVMFRIYVFTSTLYTPIALRFAINSSVSFKGLIRAMFTSLRSASGHAPFPAYSYHTQKLPLSNEPINSLFNC